MRKIIFLPVSLIWALIMSVRRCFYNLNNGQRRFEFSKPVICIGNLCMGGAGKTPHTEYLIRLLGNQYQLAVLSRGYGRNTKGFMFADASSTNKSLGDEAFLYYRKYPTVAVTVCEDRVEGLQQMWKRLPEVEVALLDDAFQHLRIKAGLTILLTDYYHLYSDDYVFPSGNLRELPSAAKEADIIVVSKAPSMVTPLEEKVIIDKLNPLPYQKVYFSYIRYGDMVPLTAIANKQQEEPKSVVVFTGIHNSYPLIAHLKEKYKDIQIYTCTDHHEFTEKDIKNVRYLLSRAISPNKAIITTEKDASRLMDKTIKDMIEDMPIYYIPIFVEFHAKYKCDFNQQIVDYVEKYS